MFERNVSIKRQTKTKIEGKKTMFIHHYTPERFIKSIIENRVLWLEFEDTRRRSLDPSISNDERSYHQREWNEIKRHIKFTGRWLWFTQEEEPPQNIHHHDKKMYRLSVDTSALNVHRWKDVSERLMSKGGMYRELVKCHNEQSRLEGDDPDKWWVSPSKLPIEKCAHVTF